MALRRVATDLTNGNPLESEPIQGVQPPHAKRWVCWSGAYGGPECGFVMWHREGIVNHHWLALYLAKGNATEGDSGGPVWDPLTHKAVGLIKGGTIEGGGRCWKTYSVGQWAVECNRMLFTPLRPGGGSDGIEPTLSVKVLSQE